MLPRRFRLCSNRDFRRTYARGKSFVHPLLVLHILRRNGMELSPTRVGFSVSKKLGKAVIRNKVKRRMREAYLNLNVNSVEPFDIVFVGRGKLPAAPFIDIEAAMQELLVKAGLLTE